MPSDAPPAPCYPPAVRVRVLYFAVVRERLGRDGDDLALPAGTTVAAACDELAERNPALRELLPRLRCAVNRAMSEPGAALRDGDELALIPPVAGGAGTPRVRVAAEPLSIDALVALVGGAEHGALVTFTGTVRRHGQQARVVRLEYEAYVPMAETVLAAIADEIEREWPGARVAVHHRVGVLAVGEAAVAIAVAAGHRREAFDACRAVIDRLKERAPIWKKEVGEDGSTWVGLGP